VGLRKEKSKKRPKIFSDFGRVMGLRIEKELKRAKNSDCFGCAV